MKKIENKSLAVAVVSLLGFMITGVLCYPYAADYDSGHLISDFIINGFPQLNDWMGWYYPSLCFVLYKLTGLELAIGVYQNVLYWLGVCLLSISLFGKGKHWLLWFLLIAFFPGSLSLITNVMNNALLFANLLLGIGLYAFYRKVSHRRWLGVLALFIVFQSIFIRREAIVYVSLLLVGMVAIEMRAWGCGVRKTALLSILSVAAVLALTLGAEKALTANIKGYHYINSIDFIAMYDMNGMSHYKNDIIFPTSIFKKQYQDKESLMEMIRNDSANFENDYASFWYHGHLSVSNNFLVEIENKGHIYLANLKYYLLFRGQVIKDYLYMSMLDFCGGVDGKSGRIEPSKLYNMFAGLTIVLGVAYNFFACAIIMLFASFKRIVPYGSRREHFMATGVWALLLLSFLMYLFSTTSLQIRYVYPVCIFIFYMLVYSICLFVERNKTFDNCSSQ